MFKIIRKADILLFFVLLIAAGALSAAFAIRLRSPGANVVVTIDGQPYGTYSLSENRTIEIANGEDRNAVRIEDGKVFMESSNCHNQVCVDHAPVSRAGESIICLPHKIIVRIEGGKESQVDAVVR